MIKVGTKLFIDHRIASVGFNCARSASGNARMGGSTKISTFSKPVSGLIIQASS